MNFVGQYLPHKKPMILIDHVVSFGDDFIQTNVSINKSSVFFDGKGVPSYIALEYMAQSIAAWSGLKASSMNEPPKIGFLLGTRKLVLNVPFFKENEKLDIYGKQKYSDGELASFECWIEHKNIKYAEAILNVYQPINISNLNLEERK